MRQEDLEKLLGPGKKRIKSLEIADNGEVTITLLVGEKEVILERTAVDRIINAPLEELPWEENSTWLEREFRAHGSFPAVARAHGFSKQRLDHMVNYARRVLAWRIQDGHELVRWEFLSRLFAEVDPKARPTLDTLCTDLDISLGNASLWKGQALGGRFFSTYFNEEKLRAIQTGDNYVYFPGTNLTAKDFRLAHLEGWPELPAGLLNELLPKLDGLETHQVSLSGSNLNLELTHHGAPLAFEVALAEPTEIPGDATLLAIDSLEPRNPVRLYRFGVGERLLAVYGTLHHVLQASTNVRYEVSED